MPLIKDRIKQASNEELLKDSRVQSMLKTIRYAEGTAGENGYRTRVGGGIFSDLSKKPQQKVYIKSIKDYSSAEGAYQFLNKTWDGVSQKLGLTDFSPRSQDLAAIELIKQRGAISYILDGDFEGAINKLSPEWASLPKSNGKGTYENQRVRDMNQLSKVYYGNSDYIKTSNQFEQNYNSIPTTPLPQISNFDKPIEFSNLAEIENEQKVENAKIELQQKQNEENLFNDLMKASQLQYVDQNQVQDYTEEEQPLAEYQNGGKIPVSSQGVYDFPEQEVIVPTNGNITMKNVPYSILGISEETGEKKLMFPEQDYFFKNTKNVYEIPQIKTKRFKNI